MSTFQRLLALRWTDEPEPRVVVRLMRAHLHAMARWATALGCEQAWPFFDLAARLQPETHSPAAELRALEAHLQAQRVPPQMLSACVRALRWDQLKALPSIARDDLPDPFEPLIAMFELGGRFRTEHGYVEVDGAAFRLGRLADHL